jgi:hypothetical protein
MMERGAKRDPLRCECCRLPEALAVAYDLPSGKFVCPACHARLRRERLQQNEGRSGHRAPAPPSGDGH